MSDDPEPPVKEPLGPQLGFWCLAVFLVLGGAFGGCAVGFNFTTWDRLSLWPPALGMIVGGALSLLIIWIVGTIISENRKLDR